MSVIVVTWEKIGNRIFDAGFIFNENDEPMLFDNFNDASNYIDNHDNEIGTYYRIIKGD